MANVVLPLGINFKMWAAQIRQDLPNLSLPIADDLSEWRDWASQVINDNPSLDGIPLPTDLAYPNDEDWRIWASYFVDSVTYLTNT